MSDNRITSRYRYVFTKIDKKPMFMIMNKCNLCPFAINDHLKGRALCSKYDNPKSTLEHKNWIGKVYGYLHKKTTYNRTEMLTQLEIPFWCRLSKNAAGLSINDTVNYIKNGHLVTESGHTSDVSIAIVDTRYIDFSKIDGESLVYKPVENKKTTRKTYKHNDTSPTTTTPPPRKLCSSCGKEKLEINRKIHNGMCDECWGEHKDDKEILYKSYINNFRLKRKKSWKNAEYKIIDNIQ